MQSGHAAGHQRQILGQPRRAAQDLLHDQSPTRQAGARREQIQTSRRMPRRAGSLKTGLLVDQILLRAQLHLTLLRDARQPARANQAHMIMRQAFGFERLQMHLRPSCALRPLGHKRFA